MAARAARELPVFMVMENVEGFLRFAGGSAFRLLMGALATLPYRYAVQSLCPAVHGQGVTRRRRIIVTAVRRDVLDTG